VPHSPVRVTGTGSPRRKPGSLRLRPSPSESPYKAAADARTNEAGERGTKNQAMREESAERSPQRPTSEEPQLGDARASQARELADQISDDLVRKLECIDEKRRWVGATSASQL